MKFTPSVLAKKLDNGMTIQLSPLDARMMDSISTAATNTDGSYSRETSSYSTVMVDPLSEDNGKNKGKLSLSNAYRHLDALAKSGELPSDIVKALKRRASFGDGVGSSGEEVSHSKTKYSSAYNPYKIEDRYLNVFMISLENNSNKIQKISLDSILVVIGYNQISPLKSEYYEKIYATSQFVEKMKNLQRFNMANETIIPPGDRVVKFFAIPSVYASNSDFQVKLIKNSEVTSFQFKMALIVETEENVNSEFTFKDFRYSGTQRREFFAVKYNDSTIPLAGHSIYVEKKASVGRASAFSLTIDPTYKKFRVGMRKEFSWVNYLKSSGRIPLEYSEWIPL
ncbi:hypothetical protein LZG74_02040 [Dyadobacter sp. CY327]|uniref:hypothetical protein n=1 Tax=Dyadobacter sp. CY327 TaxID=2907301 RepID=UPI001F1B0533|nr:hypothetical protein [Dyadobacter sp. CY327]MCE7069064.1 hypothetical protein [Dyadobacter sp. CY327]